MSGIQFELCRPIEADARQVLEWRNDPVTLAMSYHHDPKVWNSFWEEYCTRYLNPDQRFAPAFATLDDKPVAFLRFLNVPHPEGFDGITADLSINLAPQQRGKGLGAQIIRSAVALLGQRGIDYVYAEALSQNVASIKAFESAGFLTLGPKQKFIPDTGETHSIVCFLKHAH